MCIRVHTSTTYASHGTNTTIIVSICVYTGLSTFEYVSYPRLKTVTEVMSKNFLHHFSVSFLFSPLPSLPFTSLELRVGEASRDEVPSRCTGEGWVPNTGSDVRRRSDSVVWGHRGVQGGHYTGDVCGVRSHRVSEAPLRTRNFSTHRWRRGTPTTPVRHTPKTGTPVCSRS